MCSVSIPIQLMEIITKTLGKYLIIRHLSAAELCVYSPPHHYTGQDTRFQAWGADDAAIHPYHPIFWPSASSINSAL